MTILSRLCAVALTMLLAAAPGSGAEGAVTTQNIGVALAAFLRSIVSFRSPFDRFRFANGSRISERQAPYSLLRTHQTPCRMRLAARYNR